jgi:hypothetical protein
MAEALTKYPASLPKAPGWMIGLPRVEELPGWVASCHIRKSKEAQFWVLCQHNAAHTNNDDPTNRLVLTVSGGSYAIDIFDAENGERLGGSISPGDPLELTVPQTGRSVLIHVCWTRPPRGTEVHRSRR